MRSSLFRLAFLEREGKRELNSRCANKNHPKLAEGTGIKINSGTVGVVAKTITNNDHVGVVVSDGGGGGSCKTSGWGGRVGAAVGSVAGGTAGAAAGPLGGRVGATGGGLVGYATGDAVERNVRCGNGDVTSNTNAMGDRW